MIEYTNDEIPDVRTDALVVEVNCLGLFSERAMQVQHRAFPDNVAAFKTAFEAGEIEPGKLLPVDRGAKEKPRYIFNFPTRIHSKGETRIEVIDAGIDALIHQSLAIGLKSIAIPQFDSERGLDWPEIKLRLLASFARVPDITLVLFSRQDVNDQPKRVMIYTDGGAEPNPGVGGYGVVLRFGDSHKELSEGFQMTSNNRMELLAAVVGLEALKERCHVRLHSDSRYVVDAVNHGTLFRQFMSNWKPSKAKNADLWKRFLVAYARHEVEMVWVKGHAGIEDNERCDQLASQAITSRDLHLDDGYQNQKKPKNGQRSKNAATGDSADKSTKVGPKPKKVGDACRHCQTPLVRREPKKHKPDSDYYFSWYLYCENCKRLYHVEEAKVYRDTGKT